MGGCSKLGLVGQGGAAELELIAAPGEAACDAVGVGDEDEDTGMGDADFPPLGVDKALLDPYSLACGFQVAKRGEGVRERLLERLRDRPLSSTGGDRVFRLG